MGKGFAKKKKEAKKIQEQMMKYQEQLQFIEAVGQAGNGLVTITLNGDNEITNLKIKPECVDPEDVEGLEDLIKAAYKDALENLQKQIPLGTGPMTPAGGGQMPDLSNLAGLSDMLKGFGDKLR